MNYFVSSFQIRQILTLDFIEGLLPEEIIIFFLLLCMCYMYNPYTFYEIKSTHKIQLQYNAFSRLILYNMSNFNFSLTQWSFKHHCTGHH